MADQNPTLTVWCKYDLPVRQRGGRGAGTKTMVPDEAGSGLRGQVELFTTRRRPTSRSRQSSEKASPPPHITVEGDTMFHSAKPSRPQFLPFIKHTDDREGPRQATDTESNDLLL